MFSGIVEYLVKAKKIEKGEQSIRLSLQVPKNWDLSLGESINIDGVCSTVESITGDTFTVFYMAETLRKTTIEKLSLDHQFNLEKCLTLNSLIGGHLVSGHIDMVAVVADIKSEGESKTIHFKISPDFAKYLIYKGSIVVNGVSLTVVFIDKDLFSVSLIPYTLTHTNLGGLKIGDQVNIEIDLIAKYIEKLSNSA